MTRSFHYIELICKCPALFLTLLFISCDETVLDVDYSAFESSVVIYGFVKEGSDPQNIKVSRVDNYFLDNVSVLVDNAEVIISDNEGNSEILGHLNSGNYRAHNLQGVTGRTYTLTVRVDGETYTSQATMPESMELSRIVSSPVSFNNFNLELYTEDKADLEEFSRVRVYKNGGFYDEFLYSDRNSNGEQVQITLEGFRRFDRVVVELYSLSKFAYQYLRELNDLADDANSNDDEIIELASGNPPSNISNNALGYFSAQGFRRYEVVIN